MKVAIYLIVMKKITGILVLITMMIVIGGNSFAGSTSSVIPVGATVLPYAKYDILHQEGSLTISRQDIERGYIEVTRATVLSVKTNSLNGYMMNFFVAENLFSNVTLSDGTKRYSFSETGGEVHFPSQGMRNAEKGFTYRFDLRANVEPGRYQWPVAFMISPM